MDKGLIHVYCGDGKGKTTAALGLAVRAAGAGLRVVFAQFMKGSDTSELISLTAIPGITVIRNGRDLGFYNREDAAQKARFQAMHDASLRRIEELVGQGRCDVLILDEITYPYTENLIDRHRLKRLILEKPERMELALTGREPAAFMKESADYITEMRAVRHPYIKGVGARKGIEY